MSRELVSATMKTLLGRWLMERTMPARDTRAVTLTLTDAGVKLIEEVFREQNKRERQRVQALRPLQRENLQSLFLTLVRNAPPRP